MIDFEGEAIVYRETPPPMGIRIGFPAMGLICAIGITAPVFASLDWAQISGFGPAEFLFLLFFMTFPWLIGGAFVVVGLWSVTELRFDPHSGALERVLRGPVVNRRERFPLAEIPAPQIVMRDSEDGTYPILRLPLPGERRVEMSGFFDKAEAELWRDRLLRLLSASA